MAPQQNATDKIPQPCHELAGWPHSRRVKTTTTVGGCSVYLSGTKDIAIERANLGPLAEGGVASGAEVGPAVRAMTENRPAMGALVM